MAVVVLTGRFTGQGAPSVRTATYLDSVSSEVFIESANSRTLPP